MSQSEKAKTALQLKSIESRLQCRPEYGIILGSGLSHLANRIETSLQISYEEIPQFPLSTVETHSGRLIFGTLAGREVVAMKGRFHSYEGYDGPCITAGVRLMQALGIKALVVSNACGGLNPQFEAGDLVQITDHINFLGLNPLIGPNNEDWGPRFVDMKECYDPGLAQKAHSVALSRGISLKKGVYLSVQGPNLETRAEYRMLKDMGADMVGMSTVPEVIVARHMGLPVLAFSVVTDMCLPDALEPAEFESIIAVANQAEPRLTALIEALLPELP